MLTDGMSAGRVLLSTWFIGEDRTTPYDGSAETPNPLHEETSIRVWLASADVRLTKRVGMQVTFTVPNVTRTAVVPLSSGSLFNYSETFRGLGDTSVLAWGRFATTSPWILTWNGGVSLPTGKTEAPRFLPTPSEGSLVPVSRLQRGTGTFDPMAGVSASRVVKRILYPGIRVFTSAAARVPVAENDHGLRTGASWELNAGASREAKWHWLMVIGRLGWLHREQDVFHGTPVLVGGGHWLTLTPAVAVDMGEFTFQAEFRVPIYRSLSNRQLDSAFVFQAGLVWAAF